MKRPFFRLLESVRASYWFVPSVMALLAIILGAGVVWVDAGPGAGLLDGLGWYQKAKADGAREVLSTIAGSMITVAGVVFSITIVAIAYAASQYGPRILTNFMSDRGNQVTLGTFIATFVYCLVVLRTIRGGDDGGFVPQIGLMVGLLLALCSIAVLIYFIHHVPQSIHINNVVASIGRQLVRSVKRRFPACIGDPPEDHEVVKNPSSQAAAALEEGGEGVAKIRCAANGYIQAVDDETLMEVATERDVVILLKHTPGEYLYRGRVLATAWPAERLGENGAEELRRSYSIGNNRTPHHDLTFLVDELVEIAARALSPGVNDPYTAITCLDWLGAAAAEMGGRRSPSSRRLDGDGTVRVIAVPQNFASFIDRGFGRMRQYTSGDMNAALHALSTLASIAESCGSPEEVDVLTAEAERMMTLAEEELHGPALLRVRERCEDSQRRLAECRGELTKTGTIGRTWS